MLEIKKLSSNTVWEEKVGYSRAIRFGNFVEVSGTTAVDEQGNVVGVEDTYTQAKFIFEKIEKSLKELGASLKDVVRTRMYIIIAEDWEEVGKAHKEFFGVIRPVSSMLVVSELVAEELLVEIEVSAYINE